MIYLIVSGLFLLVVTLFWGGYSKRKNREKLKNEHLMFQMKNGETVMCTFQEAKDFHDLELLRRNVVKNKSAYKKMKPKKWKIGTWTR